MTALIQCDPEESEGLDRRRGILEFGIHVGSLPDRYGLPTVLAIASYVAAYSFVLEYQVLDIFFPQVSIDSDQFPGPRFGPSFVGGSDSSTRLGILIKPRFVDDEKHLRAFVREAARSGIDYLTDDELTVGGARLSFRRRLEIVREELENASGTRPKYFANILGDYESALERAFLAQELGVDGVMVNAYAMGYDVLTTLARAGGCQLGVLSNTLGRAVISKGPSFRVSTELLARLARLAGADGVYTGPMVGLIDNSQHSVAQFRRALTQPYGRGCKRKVAAAVMSGGVGLPELLKNDALYDGPLFLSIGYQFAEAFLAGVPAEVIVECVRTVWNVARERGDGPAALRSLADKGPRYEKCIQLVRAEQAVNGILTSDRQRVRE
ncbi:MAG: RuBisCO large subunit C-terminal-like domain-containing protein [Actinomycetota bacterium]|nr:RuBisCO large subunit C-terminal-like domain-containing protein [Actinomycetota bacterium]